MLSTGNQVCAEWIALHVTANPQEVVIALNWDRLKASLVQRTGAAGFVVRMPPLSVRHGQPVHESRQLSVFSGPEDHMPVIWHRAICQHSDGYPFQSFPQRLLKRGVVERRREQ
jgi:hypothetical protein